MIFTLKKIVLQRQWKYDDDYGDVFGTRWWQRVKKNNKKKMRTEKQWPRSHLYSFLFELMSLSRHYRILMMMSAAAAATSFNGTFKCHVENRNSSRGFFDFCLFWTESRENVEQMKHINRIIFQVFMTPCLFGFFLCVCSYVCMLFSLCRSCCCFLIEIVKMSHFVTKDPAFFPLFYTINVSTFYFRFLCAPNTWPIRDSHAQQYRVCSRDESQHISSRNLA